MNRERIYRNLSGLLGVLFSIAAVALIYVYATNESEQTDSDHRWQQRLKFETEQAHERGYREALVDFYQGKPRYRITEENDKAYIWKKDESSALPLSPALPQSAELTTPKSPKIPRT